VVSVWSDLDERHYRHTLAKDPADCVRCPFEGLRLPAAVESRCRKVRGTNHPQLGTDQSGEVLGVDTATPPEALDHGYGGAAAEQLRLWEIRDVEDRRHPIECRSY
jgi:hypothetical protein